MGTQTTVVVVKEKEIVLMLTKQNMFSMGLCELFNGILSLLFRGHGYLGNLGYFDCDV